MKTYNIPFAELNITPLLVLKEMGYGAILPDSRITDTLTEIFSMAEKETDASFYYDIREGEIIEDKILINNVELNSGSTINFLLKNSKYFTLFTATAGYGFENLFQKIKSEQDMIKTYIVDVLGSVIAESAGEVVEKHLENQLGNTNHTNRFSPGYCGWHLSQQVDLFKLMGFNPCGIQLSEVCLMTPIKSISGIIGIGENVSKKLYACNVCELTTCYKRKGVI